MYTISLELAKRLEEAQQATRRWKRGEPGEWYEPLEVSEAIQRKKAARRANSERICEIHKRELRRFGGKRECVACFLNPVDN